MTPEDISALYGNWIIVRRWAATWLDFLLFGGLLWALLASLGEGRLGLCLAVWLAVLAAYYPVLEGLTGRTLGKLLFGLKVVDQNGRNPGLLKAIIRTIVRLVDVNPLLMGGVPAGIAVLASKKRQRLGDMAAGTYVLRSEDVPYLGKAVPVQPPSGEPTTFSAQYASGPSALPHWQPSGLPPTNKRWAVPGAAVTLLTGIALVVGGAAAYSRAEQAGHPTTMTCGGFLRSPRHEGWYRLTGCTVAVVKATVFEQRHDDLNESDSSPGSPTSPNISRVYIPIYDNLEKDGKKTSLLLLTEDPRTCSLVEEMLKLANGDEAKLEAWARAHANELEFRKDVSGTIQNSINVTDTARDRIAKLSGDALASDYVVLKDGDRPTPGAPTFAIVIGVLVGFLSGAFWLLAFISLVDRPARSD